MPLRIVVAVDPTMGTQLDDGDGKSIAERFLRCVRYSWERRLETGEKMALNLVAEFGFDAVLAINLDRPIRRDATGTYFKRRREMSEFRIVQLFLDQRLKRFCSMHFPLVSEAIVIGEKWLALMAA